MRFNKKISLLSIVALFIFLIISFSTSNAEVKSSNPSVSNIEAVVNGKDNKAPDFTFVSDGNKVKFSEFSKGKLIFLNFWGTWCPPCRREIPDIVKISNELKNKKFEVVGIAVERDPTTAADNVAKFMTTNNITYKMLLANSAIQQAFGGISSVPTTYIIDQEGKIVEKIVGMQTYEAFMTSIKRFLK